MHKNYLYIYIYINKIHQNYRITAVIVITKCKINDIVNDCVILFQHLKVVTSIVTFKGHLNEKVNVTKNL